MPCESYKTALSEAAAGAPASEAFRSHLIVCADCRARLAEEEAIYASIDEGLRIAANAEVPATLIPSVRVLLDESAPRRRWLYPVLVPVAAALIFSVLLVRSRKQDAGESATPTLAASAGEPPATIATTNPTQPIGTSKEDSHARSAPRIVFHSVPSRGESSAEAVPQILVPRDQEALLASYAQRLQTQRFVRLTAQLLPAPSLEPREVAPIQIAPLDVKALEEADSR